MTFCDASNTKCFVKPKHENTGRSESRTKGFPMYSLRKFLSLAHGQFKRGITSAFSSPYRRARSSISVEPSSSLIDEKVRIVLSGLQPRQAVTLEARIQAENNELFESHAHFIACKNGEVDVYSDSSLGGSYSGISPMGLLWSMKPAPGQRKGLRLVKRDVTKPFIVELKCFDYHISSSKGPTEQPLSSVTFEKRYMAVGVTRIVVNDGLFHGTLFIPPGDGPFPGLLELRGGTAGIKEYRTSLLASRGFATLTLAYVSTDNSRVFPPFYELEYFEEAVEWLCKHPMVKPGGIALVGNCLGSWLSLLLASYRSDLIKAVVAVSPGTFSSFTSYKYKGKISENFPLDKSKLISKEEGVVLRYAIPERNDDNGTHSTYSAIPPYENISCPLLMVTGTGDLLMNVDFTARQIYERMKRHDKGHLCSVLRFPGAGHLIEPPYTPHCYSSLDPLSRELCGNPYMVWGGEMEAHAQAQEDCWAHVLDFLERNV